MRFSIWVLVFLTQFSSMISKLPETQASLVAGSVVKNPSANTRDMGLIPDLVHAAEQLSPCATILSLCSGAWELQVLKPTCSRACSSQEEKPLQREARAPQSRVAPACRSQRKAHTAVKTQHSQKKKKKVIRRLYCQKVLFMNLYEGLQFC